MQTPTTLKMSYCARAEEASVSRSRAWPSGSYCIARVSSRCPSGWLLIVFNVKISTSFFFSIVFIFACCFPLGFSAGSIYHGLQSRPRRHYNDQPDQKVNTSGTVPSIYISTRNYYALSYCCRYCFCYLLIHS